MEYFCDKDKAELHLHETKELQVHMYVVFEVCVCVGCDIRVTCEVHDM